MSLRRGWAAVGLAFLALAFLLLKTVPALRLPAGEQVLVTDTDSLYHLRLARLIDARYPSIPSFDPYLEFPRGAEIPWPFLMDFITATLHRLLPDPGGGGLLFIAFLTPAVVSSLALLLVYRLARALGMGRGASLLASFFTGIAPPLLANTSGGRYDHHAWDLFWLAAFLLLLVLSWREGTTRTRRGAALHGGIALVTAAMFLNWTGATIYLFVLLLGCGGALAGANREERARLAPFLPRLGGSLAAGAAVLALLTALAYGPGRLLRLDAGFPGGFQPLVTAALALFLAGAGRLIVAGKGWRGDPLLLGSAALLLLSLPVFLPTAGKVFSSLLAARDPSVFTTAEFISPFADLAGWDPSRPAFSPGRGFSYLTWAAALFPFALGLIRWKGFPGRGRGGDGEFPISLFLSLGLVQFVLALARHRFGLVFSLPLGIASAALAARLAGWGRGKGILARGAAWAGALLLVSCFLPGARTALGMWRAPLNQPLEPATISAAAWLANHTPPPSDFLDPRQPPAYGVMAPWGEGGTVVTAGLRPVMATPFQGYLGSGDLFRLGVGWFLEPDPAAAHEFLRRNRLRYVLLVDNPRYTAIAAYTLGRPGLFRALVEGRNRDLVDRGLLPVSSRLWEGRGNGTRHFRLVWEGESLAAYSGKVQPVRIFEVVPGAALRGRARPGREVTASLVLQTLRGERFLYRDQVTAGADGGFEMILPYPASTPVGGPGAGIRALGPWEIEREGWPPARVEVSPESVTRGETLTLSRPGEAGDGLPPDSRRGPERD